MSFVRRNSVGQIVAICRDAELPLAQGASAWEAVDPAAPDVVAFVHSLAAESNALTASDLSLVRVLEDVIDLLIERGVFRFTDLPAPAQAKLMERRSRRAAMSQLSLLDESDKLI